MMDWNNSWSAGNWAVMGLMMLVLWSLLAVAVVAVVRASRGRAEHRSHELNEKLVGHDRGLQEHRPPAGRRAEGPGGPAWHETGYVFTYADG
jgi:hypothetical protein